MHHKILNPTSISGSNISTVCPHCNVAGVFVLLTQSDVKNQDDGYIFGQRRCPNPSCRGHLFFEINGMLDNYSLKIYPSSKINFNKDGIPTRVLAAFEEAITCHSSNCYVASAIMLRKTLEEICNEKGADGSNLFKRLQSLATIIIVPKELVEATQDLRLLGNDAAHLEAETYEQIGKEEIEISIEFTKEIIKAVYQYQGLLGKLRGLKKVTQ
jgi:hypothetical protein